EPEAVCRQVVMVVAAVRGSTPEGVHVPGTPSETAPRLVVSPVEPRPAVVGSADVVGVPYVRAPLPNVSEHVVQTPRVWPLQSHPSGAFVVFVDPREVAGGSPGGRRYLSVVLERVLRAEEELSRSPRPARVFPFGLGGQSDATPAPAGEPL